MAEPSGPASSVNGATRQQKALELAEELLGDIELSRSSTTKHVLKATRLARLIRDENAEQWLEFELSGAPDTEAGGAWMTRTRRWTDRAERKGHWSPAADIEATRARWDAAMGSVSGDVNLSGDAMYVTMNTRLQYAADVTNNSLAMSKILAAIDTQIYSWVTDVYAELCFSAVQASLFENARTEVDATYAQMAGETFKKFESISERLNAGNNEAVSHAMTTCRRLIDSVADHVFAAREEPYNLEGQPLAVDQSRTLNRINAYLHSAGVTGARAQRLRRSVSDLYGRVSAGVHSDVDPHEARYVFLECLRHSRRDSHSAPAWHRHDRRRRHV